MELENKLNVETHNKDVSPDQIDDLEHSIRRIRTSIQTGRGALYKVRIANLVIVAVLVMLVGSLVSSYLRYGIVLATIYAIVILGNNALYAVFGELNLSGGAFVAVGAYVSAISLNHGVPWPLAALLAVIAAGALGTVVALPFLRVQGIATALVTFAFAFSIPGLVVALGRWTGGSLGMYLDKSVEVAGLSFSGSETSMLILCVVVFVCLGVAHVLLFSGNVGRRLLVVGEAPAASAVFGGRTFLLRLSVWLWAATLAGMSGFLYALTVGYLSSSQWVITLSIFILAGGLIGGARSASGAWLGGLLVGALPLWLQNIVPATASYVLFGAILIIALAMGGRGVASVVEKLGASIYFKWLQRNAGQAHQ